MLVSLQILVNYNLLHSYFTTSYNHIWKRSLWWSSLFLTWWGWKTSEKKEAREVCLWMKVLFWDKMKRKRLFFIGRKMYLLARVSRCLLEPEMGTLPFFLVVEKDRWSEKMSNNVLRIYLQKQIDTSTCRSHYCVWNINASVLTSCNRVHEKMYYSWVRTGSWVHHLNKVHILKLLQL